MSRNCRPCCTTLQTLRHMCTLAPCKWLVHSWAGGWAGNCLEWGHGFVSPLRGSTPQQHLALILKRFHLRARDPRTRVEGENVAQRRRGLPDRLHGARDLDDRVLLCLWEAPLAPEALDVNAEDPERCHSGPLPNGLVRHQVPAPALSRNAVVQGTVDVTRNPTCCQISGPITQHCPSDLQAPPLPSSSLAIGSSLMGTQEASGINREHRSAYLLGMAPTCVCAARVVGGNILELYLTFTFAYHRWAASRSGSRAQWIQAGPYRPAWNSSHGQGRSCWQCQRQEPPGDAYMALGGSLEYASEPITASVLALLFRTACLGTAGVKRHSEETRMESGKRCHSLPGTTLHPHRSIVLKKETFLSG